MRIESVKSLLGRACRVAFMRIESVKSLGRGKFHNTFHMWELFFNR
jgi:hypothetical protein